jgi:hypothetical protein
MRDDTDTENWRPLGAAAQGVLASLARKRPPGSGDAKSSVPAPRN